MAERGQDSLPTLHSIQNNSSGNVIGNKNSRVTLIIIDSKYENDGIIIIIIKRGTCIYLLKTET